VLLIVLVVVMLASMVAASLLFVLSAEHVAAAAGERGEQAWTTAMSGVYQGLRVASEAAPGSLDWQDNPAVFQDQLVCDDGTERWYFSVYSALAGGGIRYGLTDEGGKLNLYNSTPAMLEALPNLTPTLVEDLLTSMGGGTAVAAGSDSNNVTVTNLTITGSSQRWTCLDELLNVDGFNPQLLYGDYTILSGRLDSQGNPASLSTGANSLEEEADIGLSHLLTVCTYDLNLDNEGQPRVNLNEPDADLSHLNLPESTVTYLKAMQRNGQSLSHPAGLLEAKGEFKDEKGKTVELSSGIGKAELPALLDRCTATNQPRLVGLVNLNTAPAAVLAALPGLNSALAESIVSAREGLSPDARKTPAWLYQDGLVSAETFKQLVPYLTTRSRQFHFFVAGYSVPAANYRVLEVIVDAGVKPAAVLLLRDVSRLGLPFVPGAEEELSVSRSDRAALAWRANHRTAGPQNSRTTGQRTKGFRNWRSQGTFEHQAIQEPTRFGLTHFIGHFL